MKGTCAFAATVIVVAAATVQHLPGGRAHDGGGHVIVVAAAPGVVRAMRPTLRAISGSSAGLRLIVPRTMFLS